MRQWAAFLIAYGVLLAFSGTVPWDWIRPLGPMIGRPNAVTADVYLRTRLVVRLFAAVCFLLALSARFHPSLWRESMQAWQLERRRWTLSEAADWPWIVGTTLAGFVARVIHLQTPMAYDESYTFLNYARKSALEAIADYESTNNHLLNTWIMHWLYELGGSQESVLRLGVFAAGVLLIPCAYYWALTWMDRPAAMLTMVLTAMAPALVTYSFDARGYGYVTLAAVVFDWSLRQLLAGTSFPWTWTAVSIVAAVLGLWAMPIMLYAILGSGGYFVIRCISGKEESLSQLLTQCALWLCAVGLTVFALYTPAFIYRGLMFLRDPIMRPVAQEDPFAASLGGWRGAWEWWTSGIFPSSLWAACLAIAAMACVIRRKISWAWLSPFAAVQLVNLLKSSSPPPRIYQFLTPWIALGVAYGFQAACRAIRCPSWCIKGIRGIVLLASLWFACRSPVMIFPEERNLFLDVPAVVAAVQKDLSTVGGSSARLLSPLPVNYPTRFYLERAGATVPMNGQPLPGEWIYVIGLPELSMTEVLKRPPIQLEDESLEHAVWTPCPIPKAASHPGNLTLWRTRLSEAPKESSFKDSGRKPASAE